jgi:DNA-binding MarR family transcriptional regulator
MNETLTAPAFTAPERPRSSEPATGAAHDSVIDPLVEWPDLTAAKLSALAAGEDLVARLRLAMIRLTRQLRRSDPAGLSVAAVSALTTIALGGQMTLGELAEAERLQSPSVTRIVDRLEEAGLVRRVPSSDDRRIIRAVATDAGHQLLEQRWCEGNAFLASRIASLDPDEQVALRSTVDLLEALVGESRSSNPLD